jgi:hypothetical protein
MESEVKTNGIANGIVFYRPFLIPESSTHSERMMTVQQALCKWYKLFSTQLNFKKAEGTIFPVQNQEDLLNCLQTDIELVPSLLMDEFISDSFILDKEQYIRLVQALLINLSDCLLLTHDEYTPACNQIEQTIEFIRNFFYRQFDLDSRVSRFCSQQFLECFKLKLDYWQIKLNHSPLLTAMEECLADKFILPESNITYRKISYLKHLMQEIESATSVISESYIRKVLIWNNFNSSCFIHYETELIKAELGRLQNNEDAVQFLQSEQNRVLHLKVKPDISFDHHLPSIKKQLADWIAEEIKQLEIKNKKAGNKDLLVDPESKIQTSLSVAKLAVLIRLLVVDKIIINKSVAPMLRTVTKLFTTLQKDEISFGSLETKYHAPDKTTLTTMKDMMQKWAGILGKL